MQHFLALENWFCTM